MIYGLLNIVGVVLAAEGIVHPPWDILNFFTFIGPTLGILLVGSLNISTDERPFTWFAVIGFAFAMMCSSYLNFLALMSASAAV